MTLWYIIVFLVGIISGLLYACLPTSPPRRRSYRTVKDRLDDVDDMVLWGEVTNDSFYKGE